MSRLSIAAAEAEAVEVDLWGTIFNLVPVTRTRQRAIAELQKQFDALEEDDENLDDKAVALLAEMLDHAMAPEAGKRRKPSAVIVEKWEADELEFKRLIAFVQELTEAAAGRPT